MAHTGCYEEETTVVSVPRMNCVILCYVLEQGLYHSVSDFALHAAMQCGECHLQPRSYIKDVIAYCEKHPHLWKLLVGTRNQCRLTMCSLENACYCEPIPKLLISKEGPLQPEDQEVSRRG